MMFLLVGCIEGTASWIAYEKIYILQCHEPF